MFYVIRTIGGNLFIINPKNMNNVHKDRKGLRWVIIILETKINGGETFFYGLKTNIKGKRAHVIKHSHGMCVVGEFGNNKTMKDLFGLDTDLLYNLSYINQYVFTLYTMELSFITDI